jgi:hypothetical protein
VCDESTTPPLSPERRKQIEKMLKPVLYDKVPPLTISDQLLVRELLAEIDRLKSALREVGFAAERSSEGLGRIFDQLDRTLEKR